MSAGRAKARSWVGVIKNEAKKLKSGVEYVKLT